MKKIPASEAAEMIREKWRERLKEKSPSPLELELVCLRNTPWGHPCKHLFALAAMQLQWDFLYLEKDGIENYWFRRIVKHWFKHRKVNLMGAASSSKTFTPVACAYTVWKSSPWNTTVILSTTDMGAAEARGWGTIKDLHTKDRLPLGVRLEYKKCIVLQEDKNDKERDYRDAIMAVAVKTGGEGERAIASICGRKNENVFWICDELNFMDLACLEARQNLFSNPFFHWTGCSNKPNEGDAMYLDAEPQGEEYPDGWKSIDPDRDETWPIRGGVCLYFNGEKSPNLQTDGPPPFPRLTTREFIERTKIESGGEDSPGYWRWVKGFPNQGDIQDRVLTAKVLQSFDAVKEAVWSGNSWETVAGLDLGLKEDGDPCVADFGKVGLDFEGRRVLECEKDTVTLTQAITAKEPYEDQIARKFLEECRKRNCHAVALDISGGGGLMALAIRKFAQEAGWSLEITSVDFGGTPSEDEYDVGGEKKPAKELFDRKVSELWYSFRLSVQNRCIRGMVLQAKAVKELCERKVIQDEKRRWKVETKKEMKKRIRRSPDNGDARVLLHLIARKHGLERSTTPSAAKKVTIELPRREDGQKRAYVRSWSQRRGY